MSRLFRYGAPEEAENVVVGLSVFFCAVLATRVMLAADLLDNDGQESWGDAPSRTFGLGICGPPGPEDYGTGHGDAREFRSPQEPQEFHWSPVKLEESCRRDFSFIAKCASSRVVDGITCVRVVIVKCRESVEGHDRAVFVWHRGPHIVLTRWTRAR